MRVVSARLSKILAEAESLHSAAEAGFLSDIAWLTDEFDALDLPSDQAAVWRARIGILRDEVYRRLGRFPVRVREPVRHGRRKRNRRYRAAARGVRKAAL